MNYSREISTNFTTELNALSKICIQFLNRKKTVFENENAFDTKSVQNLARRHRIQRIIPLPSVEVNNIEEFKNRQLQGTKRAIKIVAELINIQNILEADQHTFLVLKGPANGAMLYGDTTFRISRDLDILVEESKLEVIENTLRHNGYERTFPAVEISPKQQSFFLKEHNQMVYVHPDRKINIELHWRLFKNYDLVEEEKDLFKVPFQIEINSRTISTLPPPLLFKYLCIHGANHGWSSLNWLLDVSLLIEKFDLDWQQEFEAIKESGFKRAITQMYILRELIFEIKAPEYITQFYIKDNYLKSMVEYALGSLNAQIEVPEKGIKGIAEQKKYRSLISKEHQSGYSWYSVRHFEIISLPDSLFFLYVPLRPFLWFWRYIN